MIPEDDIRNNLDFLIKVFEMSPINLRSFDITQKMYIFVNSDGIQSQEMLFDFAIQLTKGLLI